MEKLTIENLKDSIDLFSPIQCDFLSENCIVALETNNHVSGCQLAVEGESATSFELEWTKSFSTSGYKERKKIIEHGAEALSFLLTTKFTDFTIVEEALIGTGLDYWLGYESNHEKYDPKNFFQARLEISGIDKESVINNVKKRVRQKIHQTDVSDQLKLPAYISVIEFSTPKGYFAKK